MAKQYWQSGTMLYPIPAVMVSCKREGEKPNIITIAWAGTVNTSPAMVSISVRKERYSYDVIRETGEFVINLVTADLAFAADFCGVRSGRNLDKFKEMGLTELTSRYIKAPGIAESPVNIECRVKQIIPLGTHDMFVAEVLGVTTDDRYLDKTGKFNLNDVGLVTYSHGEYFELGKKIGKFGYSVQKTEKKKKNASKKSDTKNQTEKKQTEKRQMEKKSTEGSKSLAKREKKTVSKTGITSISTQKKTKAASRPQQAHGKNASVNRKTTAKSKQNQRLGGN